MDVTAAEVSDIDTFELELRKLAGVAAVGFSEEHGDLTVHLAVPAQLEHRHVYLAAAEIARLYLDLPVRVVIEPVGEASQAASRPQVERFPTSRLHSVPLARDDRDRWSGAEGSQIPDVEPAPEPEPAMVPHPTAFAHEATDPPQAPPQGARQPPLGVPGPAPLRGAHPDPSPPARPARVALLGVQLAANGNEVEVHLILDGVRSIGRGPAGRPSAVVVATIQALKQLGWPIPFTVRNAVRLAMGVDGAVAVSLSGPGGDRLGMSRGSTADEAAAKATLHALNRYLGESRQRPT